jgi:hypothetical protein
MGCANYDNYNDYHSCPNHNNSCSIGCLYFNNDRCPYNYNYNNNYNNIGSTSGWKLVRTKPCLSNNNSKERQSTASIYGS